MKNLEKKSSTFIKEKKIDYYLGSFNLGIPQKRGLNYVFNISGNGDRRRQFFLPRNDTFELISDPIRTNFLFSLKTYSSCVLYKSDNLFLHKPKTIKDQIFKMIRNKSDSTTFFSGHILKKVKGGFIIDLLGFICFMPLSLSENNIIPFFRFYLNSTQFFDLHGSMGNWNAFIS